MSDRLKQIVEKSPRVVMSLATPGYWRPAGIANDPTEGQVVAKADLAWMARVVGSTEAIMRDRNTWARQLVDMQDERDTAREDLEKYKADQSEALDWATNRVADLDVAVRKLLEADKDRDFGGEFDRALRNLRAVWARA